MSIENVPDHESGRAAIHQAVDQSCAGSESTSDRSDHPARGRLSFGSPIKEGAALAGYSPVYVRLLARDKRIEARKVGRDWLIERASLLAFKAAMDALGSDKHNPWRDDLPGEGGLK